MRHGFVLIHKPEGPTSHDIVAQVRRALSERKVGHLGTLDPAASGLMVLAVGAKALKVVELFHDLHKEYIADIEFGAVSATYDREGPIEEYHRKAGVDDPDESKVLLALQDRFIGSVDQVPPAASAIKIGGERAYRKMRQGIAVDMPMRTVEIHSCRIVSYAYPQLRLHVSCSSGTYIRSLAHDLGQLLRVGGYLAALQRTKVGDFSLEHAVSTDSVRWTSVIPLKEVLREQPSIEVTSEEYEALRHGKILARTAKSNDIAWCNGLPVALVEPTLGGMKARKVL